MKDLQERVKDAKEATKAAIEEGIIAGGGVTLIRAGKVLAEVEKKAKTEDEKTGVRLIAEILEEPLRMLATNSGEDAGWVVGKVKDKNQANWGFNALTNEFEDLLAAGVIEPAKVAIASLVNAAGVASMILTTECLVADAPKKEEPALPAGGGMPGMM
jgi:chaperonin GroEL